MTKYYNTELKMNEDLCRIPSLTFRVIITHFIYSQLAITNNFNCVLVI